MNITNLNGVHTWRGNDKQFAKINKYMSAAYLAYKHYGRLSYEYE